LLRTWQAHRVAALLTQRLCGWYLDVATGAADALTHPYPHHHSRIPGAAGAGAGAAGAGAAAPPGAAAHRWLARGAQLADVLADEDPSGQLYRLLRPSDLAALLSRIHDCALRMLEICPRFTVEPLA